MGCHEIIENVFNNNKMTLQIGSPLFHIRTANEDDFMVFFLPFYHDLVLVK